MLGKWLDYRNFEQAYWPKMVTHTFYDNVSDFAFAYTGFTSFRQKPYTLRNRVSYTRYYDELGEYGPDIYGSDSVYLTQYPYYNTGTEYSYDIHGNVDSMIHIFYVGSIMSPYGHNWLKLISYKYDLISGKVNEVHYNPGEADEFYHRYEYDAENRLTDVYTANNKAFMYQPGLEEHDAHYDYYKHGPLARMVLGQQQVQGVDYAYTVQGWLKGVNSTSMNPDYDMGQDGKTTSANQYIARDEYGFNLNYFTGEYSSISGIAQFPGHSGLFSDASNYRPLYNGNISSMAVNIKKLNQPQLYNYKYDQLNRITRMDVFRGLNESTNQWSNPLSPVSDYKERIAYDANGNILKYYREGVTGNLDMDKLAYHYNANANQLNYVEDSVSSSNYSNDIDNQSSNNYQYDEIGNLVHDQSEGGMNITWNVYGKITNIERSPAGDNTVINTDYKYDESGNRVGKIMWYYASPEQIAKYDWYVRDAQGNVLAVYESKLGFDYNWGPLKLIEHHVYGSSRLGIIQRDQNMDSLKADPVNQNLIGSTYFYYNKRGKKLFELTNHLGNVLVTVSDKKIGADVNSDGVIDYYVADVLTASDYAPFGMQMVGRSFKASSAYRYGYNGKENDNEVKGEGNEIDYGARVYDPRVGRFLSTDPLTKDYPFYTPYQYAGNMPIMAIDLDGLEITFKDVWNNKANLVDWLSEKAEDGMTWVNENINPLYISYQHGWEIYNKKDFYTGLPKSRIDAISATGVDAVMWAAGEKTFTGLTRTGNVLEKQMIKTSVVMGQTEKTMIQKEAQTATNSEIKSTVVQSTKTNTAKALPNPYSRFYRFETKYASHAKTFGTSGTMNRSAYYNRAVRLADSQIGGDILGFTSEGNTTFKLNKKTGEFIVINPDGKISSFYRRVTDPVKYLEEQKLKYGVKKTE